MVCPGSTGRWKWVRRARCWNTGPSRSRETGRSPERQMGNRGRPGVKRHRSTAVSSELSATITRIAYVCLEPSTCGSVSRLCNVVAIAGRRPVRADFADPINLGLLMSGGDRLTARPGASEGLTGKIQTVRFNQRGSGRAVCRTRTSRDGRTMLDHLWLYWLVACRRTASRT